MLRLSEVTGKLTKSTNQEAEADIRWRNSERLCTIFCSLLLFISSSDMWKACAFASRRYWWIYPHT